MYSVLLLPINAHVSDKNSVSNASTSIFGGTVDSCIFISFSPVTSFICLVSKILPSLFSITFLHFNLSHPVIVLSLLSSPLPISYHQHDHSYNTFVQPENSLQKDAAWENWAATIWFSSLPPSVKHSSSCLIHPYIKLTLEAGKWKENECHAGTYFFNEFFFTPDSDPNPTIGSTWLAV